MILTSFFLILRLNTFFTKLSNILLSTFSCLTPSLLEFSAILFSFILDFEAQVASLQAKRANLPKDLPKEDERIGLTDTGVFDQDIYSGGKGKFEGNINVYIIIS